MIVEIAKSNKTPVKKLVVKPSPLQKSLTSLGAGQHQQIIVLPSNLLLNSNKDQPTVLRLASSSPTAAKIVHVSSPKSAVVGLKRPIPKIEVEDDNDSVSGEPTRKRANLDHLTPEEKLMRRKLKNRVAAQNARDKKRVKMDDMEAKMKELEAENARIMSENASLKALNNRLMEENQVLSQPFGTTKLVPDSVVLQQQQEGRMLPTPPPSECPSSPPESLAAAEHGPVDLRSFESAELINEPRQQGQDRTWAGLMTAMLATTVPMAFCLAATSAAAATSSESRTSLSKKPSMTWSDFSLKAASDSMAPTASLPLKKRTHPAARVPQTALYPP